MSEKTLRICHLYPDLLNLYGDRGNILCMRRRLEWRGIDAEVVQVEDLEADHRPLHIDQAGKTGGGGVMKALVHGLQHGQA